MIADTIATASAPKTGEIRYIEVKSFKTSGDPELTEHEYEVAKILSSRY